MASYNTSGVTSYTDTSSIAGISAASGKNYGSSSSGLMSSSSSKGRNRDADMYAGSKYAPTSNAGTAKAKQSFTAHATDSDDDNKYTPAAIAYKFEAAGATLPTAKDPRDRFRNTMASSLYDTDKFKPYVPDPTEEIESYLANTAVEDAINEALGLPEVYLGTPTQEEPELNIDMSVLQGALQPEPITVEELPDTAGLMTRPKSRPTGLRALSEPEKNKAAQKYLGITADGIWGKGSIRKLAGWQYQNGVPVSGVLDEATIKAMENPETEDPRKEIARKSVLNTAGTAPDISKVKDWAKENIKDPMRAAAFVATVEAETGGRALVESGHTLQSAVRTFVTNNKYMHEGNDLSKPLTAKGKRRKQKLEALGSNATGDEIFDFIYGPDTDAIGANLGNTTATDGSKYKGRGLVQITGKDNYRRVGDIIGVDLVNNPELVKDPKYAAAAAMAYLTLPGKDFFYGTLTSDKLASAIGHTGSAATRWSRATALKNEMYP